MQMVTTLQEIFKQKSIIKITLLILLPLIFYLMPSDLLNSGPTLCIYRNITGSECYACGTSRAIYKIMHLEFAGAYNYNKLSFIVFILLFVIWLKMLVGAIKK